jgi:hypothetical protein
MRVRRLLFAGFAVLCSGADISWNFEGGRLDRAEQVGPRHWRLHIPGEVDQDGRNRQASWFYIRVSNAGRERLLIDLVGLPGEYNYTPNLGPIDDRTPPVISYDREKWDAITMVEYDKSEPRLRLRVWPKKPTFWIARVPPYTNTHLDDLRSRLRRRAGFREEAIGQSVEGRQLYLWTIGEAAPGRPVAWLMVRQHSWESPTSWVGEGAALALTANDAEGRDLRGKVLWKIFPLCDPDGVARGGVRFNRKGYDLNRNWDLIVAEKMPEIAAQHAAIRKWLGAGNRIDLYLTLHNTETAEYIQASPQAGGRLAARFFESLTARTMFQATQPLATSPRTTTEGKPGRMSVVQGLARDFGLPAFLMEQRISRHPRLERIPTLEDRLHFGRDLVHVIRDVLVSP